MNYITTRVLKPCFYTHVDALVLSVASVSFSAHMIQIDTLNLSYYYHKIRDCINEGKHVWFTVWNRLRIHLFMKFITITILKYKIHHTLLLNRTWKCDVIFHLFSLVSFCQLFATGFYGLLLIYLMRHRWGVCSWKVNASPKKPVANRRQKLTRQTKFLIVRGWKITLISNLLIR